MSIIFLTIEQIIEIHQDQIQRYGGIEIIRDYSLLESAVNQAQASFSGEYLHNSIFDMAAAYLFHIVNNHPFMDGNKRVGFMSAYVFLQLNNYEIQCSNELIESFVLQIAQGANSKQIISSFLKKNSQEITNNEEYN